MVHLTFLRNSPSREVIRLADAIFCGDLRRARRRDRGEAGARAPEAGADPRGPVGALLVVGSLRWVALKVGALTVGIRFGRRQRHWR